MEDERTHKHIDEVSDRIGRFEDRVVGSFKQVDHRFDRFERQVDKRFDRVETAIERLASKVDTTNRTIWGGVLVLVVAKFLFG